MRFASGVLLALTLLIVLAACSGEASSRQNEPGRNVAELIKAAGQAATLAQAEAADVVLRQLDVGRDPVRWIISFTDAAATQAVNVMVPVEDVPIEEWEVITGISPLVGHQSLGPSLDGLRIGPGKVVKAVTKHWNGCPVHGLSLIGEEGQLAWYLFCNLPERVVSGTMDGVTGEFVPSLAPSAILPPTATPG